MTDERAVYRRVLRRETRASRTVAAVIVASIAVALLLAAVAACVWWFGDAAFRVVARDALAAVPRSGGDRTAFIIAGGIAVILALLLLALAVFPGRRARRGRTTPRAALLVDDGVIADAVADAVSVRCGVDRRRISVVVGRRIVSVRITPTSGVPVDEGLAAEVASLTVSDLGFMATPRVVIAADGVVA